MVESPEGFELRWFTTLCEIRLCGHGTLAAALIALKVRDQPNETVRFKTGQSGILEVRRAGELLQMDFPALFPDTAAPDSEQLRKVLGLLRAPSEIFCVNQTWIAVLNDSAAVIAAQPDFNLLKSLHPYAAALTAPGEDEDFVSRYFAPSYGVAEDAVTGSLHCALTPYWSRRLGKNELHARQLSKRGGELWCEIVDDRVRLRGDAVLVMQGTLTI